jgi:NhaP-type Na+/H+ or K+/H+ antiporter
MLGLGLLGLRDLGEFGLQWVLFDVLWATVAGVAIGALAGAALAHVAWKLRRDSPEHKLMDDFLGLGLIGVVYGLSVLVGAIADCRIELQLAPAALAGADRDQAATLARATCSFL